MKRTAQRPTGPEGMGLRLEDTTRVRALDVAIVVALVVSGVAWVWVSFAGVEPELLAALATPAGRLIAALVGVASVAAVFRAFLVSRWPVSDNDQSLL
jgi:hypothetical protein